METARIDNRSGRNIRALSAHHSFSAEFDVAKLTGVVTKVQWLNPHTFSHIDVTEFARYRRLSSR